MKAYPTIPIRVAPSSSAVDHAVAAAPRSGEKYTTRDGFAAIRHGLKASVPSAAPVFGDKPAWVRALTPAGKRFEHMDALVESQGLVTVCKEARCPNIGECWNAGTATLMLLGRVCTRACRFCAVDTGNPGGRVDADEPENVARTVGVLGLMYVVLTSVNRDDLPDGGASHFADTVRMIHAMHPETAVEALVPDFRGNLTQVDTVLASGLQVFAQNLETVRRLTRAVRDPRAGYDQTLAVLRHAGCSGLRVITKTSLMLGLGETYAEVLQAMDDLRAANVGILTLGQYMRPTSHHLPVHRWVPPDEFLQLRQAALDRGFLECVAGPLVRSSYRAEQALSRNNANLPA